MKLDTAKLKQLAEQATRGEWSVWTSNSVRRITTNGKQDGGVLSAITCRDGMPDLYGNNRDNDLAYIAAASPDVVLALLSRLERLEAGLADALMIGRSMAGYVAMDNPYARRSEREVQLDSLRTLLSGEY